MSRLARWWRALWHRHNDPTWHRIDVNDYHQCGCGARRVARSHPGGHWGPVAHGWPALQDQHGRPLLSSGWVAPPSGGWPPGGYPHSMIRVRAAHVDEPAAIARRTITDPGAGA